MFNFNKKNEIQSDEKNITTPNVDQPAQSVKSTVSVNDDNNVRETTISAGTLLRGEIKNENNITINGTVEGDVFSQKLTQVGKDGKVIGSIKATKVVINGQLKGSCHAQVVLIMSRGKVEGDIHASEFSIEKGGVFIGNSLHTEESGAVNEKKGKKQVEMISEHSHAGGVQNMASKNDKTEIKISRDGSLTS